MRAKDFALSCLLLLAAPLSHAADKNAAHAGAANAVKKTAPAAQPSAAQKLFAQWVAEPDQGARKALSAQLQALADQGDPEAAGYAAALMYPRDLNRVLGYVLQSFTAPAPLAREALLIQGLRCEGGFNEKLAMDTANRELQATGSSAEKKAAALTVLGLLSEYGGGGIAVSKTKALDYFRQAADLDSPFAWVLQGRIYEFDGGKEVPVDKARALELYKSAADRKDPYGFWLYAGLKQELGDGKDWEALVREAARLGNEGAMADLGEWLVKKGDDKSRDEGVYWLRLAMRLNNPYAYKLFAGFVEEGRIPVERPAATAWSRYREASLFPCGALHGPDGMARVLLRLKDEPAEVIKALSKDGITALATDMLMRNAANKNVREAAWAWALSRDNRDAVDAQLTLLQEAIYSRIQYDEPDASAKAGQYAAELFTPMETILIKSEGYLTETSDINAAIDQRLGKNAALSAEARAALSAALRGKVAAINQRARDNHDRAYAEQQRQSEAMARERRHASWVEAKRQDPNSLSADEFRNCMAAAGRMEQMDEQIREMDARLDNKSFVIDTLKALAQAVESTGGSGDWRGHNEAVREYNAIAREKNRSLDRHESVFRRFDSDCLGSHSAPTTMVEELCAGGRDNLFCKGFD